MIQISVRPLRLVSIVTGQLIQLGLILRGLFLIITLGLREHMSASITIAYTVQSSMNEYK